MIEPGLTISGVCWHCRFAIIGRDVEALGVFGARSVHATLVDIFLAASALVARVAQALEPVDQIQTLAAGAARLVLTLVDLGLAVWARVAGLALAPVAGRLVVVEGVAEGEVDEGCGVAFGAWRDWQQLAKRRRVC